MSGDTPEDRAAFIDRFLTKDDPPSSSSPHYGLLNMVSPTTRQKSERTSFRLRTSGETPEELSAVLNMFKSDFDLYMVELYKWFCIPPQLEDADSDFKMAQLIEYRIRENLEREIAFHKRKEACIEDIRRQEELKKMGSAGPGNHCPAALEGLDADDEKDGTMRKANIFESHKPAQVIRAKDCERISKRDEFIVFSFMEVPHDNPYGLKAAALVKIHGVFDDHAEAMEHSKCVHQTFCHKHFETCVALTDVWLSVPPPEDAPVTYGDDEHDAIYKDRWSKKQKAEIQAVHDYHNKRGESKELKQ